MNVFAWRLLTCSLLLSFNVFGQKLKKADRRIVSNIQAHVKYLTSEQLKGRVAGSEGELLAGEYISKQLAGFGLKPKGDTNTWFQKFEIYDGKIVLQPTELTINQNKLRLFHDYFPFAFSANKNAEAAVAIALAENGVPWFKDLKEITDTEDSTKIDTAKAIREKAIAAAQKGATALIVYNSASDTDLLFDKYDQSDSVGIPVIYIRNAAFKKYCTDESEILDISLNVVMQPKRRIGNNIIGFADNKADSTVITAAHLDKEGDVAALIEVARLLKPAQAKNKNYLFIAYSSEKEGTAGSEYFRNHAPINLAQVDYAIDLDTVTVSNENLKGLHLVKRSVELIKNN